MGKNIIVSIRKQPMNAGQNKVSLIHILKHKLKLDKRCNKISWHFFLSSITKGLDDLFILKGVHALRSYGFDFLTFIPHCPSVYEHSCIY